MKSRSAKKRLDLLLVERGLAESLAKARAVILAGQVWIDETRAQKAGAPIAEDARITLTTQKYASRAGLKLEGALADFAIDPAGCVCLDIGSSTGGFSDCLLQKGASRVYAVDVNIADQGPATTIDDVPVDFDRFAGAALESAETLSHPALSGHHAQPPIAISGA